MKKNYLIGLLALSCFAGKGYAQQRCASDEMRKVYREQHPEAAEFEKKMSADIARFISNANMPKFAAKTTATAHADTDYYDIPVVIHVMHNYGSEIIADNDIYKLIDNMNKFYNAQNDLSAVIAPFRRYIGNGKIRFHLATKDPLGNPTKGITHRFTYLTFGGDDQVKMDLWPPQSYYNIWFENVIGKAVTGGTVLAYATFPTSSATNPFYDGVISGYQYINDATYTIQHETGHYLSLEHPWNSAGDINSACGDDEVDDTPPTKGHFSTCPLYDTTCATNYFKFYTTAAGTDSLENYPDTTNVQNVMDYSSCTNMFTKGQIWRIRATLNSTIADRNNLWDSTNLSITGADVPYGDLSPVADFSVKSGAVNTFFTFPGVPLTFASKSWGDTITKVEWTFSNTAATPTSSQSGAAVTANLTNSFSDPGWVKVDMNVTGNNTPVTTKSFDKAVFVADAAGIDVSNYAQTFSPTGDRDKWPTFNYYNNEFKWQLSDAVGFHDNTSMMYNGFDARLNPTLGMIPLTGTPKGDFDDMFSIPVDLAQFTDACNLNFYYSGASRSSNSADITDSLVIEYSANKSLTWTNLATLSKGSLINHGALPYPFVPTSITDWAAKSIALPAGARKNYVVFRFRYKPGVNTTSLRSTGNNFYIDAIHFNRLPADVSMLNMGDNNVAVVPNPTQGDAYVVIKDTKSATAQIVVTDVTGRVVFTNSQAVSGNEATIQIPHSAIAMPGMYVVQTTTGAQVSTQKLVVY